MTPSDQKRAEEILQRISKLEKFLKGVSEEEFYRNELLKDACHANLIVIAEAMAKMSQELKAESSDRNWKEITGFRNMIIHEYLE